jgi:hypothetical protein
MMRFHYKHVVGFISLLCAVSQPDVHATEVVWQLPPGTLGFAVVRDIGTTDGKLERLITALQLPTFGPLEFLRTATGIGDGLDVHGEFMLALLPSEAAGRQFEYCVWLPVSNYDRLLESVGSRPNDGITAVTIAGEDLLIAKRDKWAVVMDPDRRDLLENLLAVAARTPDTVRTWEKWVDASDVAVVALEGGVQELFDLFRTDQLAEAQADSNKPDDDLFGPADRGRYRLPDQNDQSGEAVGILGRAYHTIRSVHAAVPELQQWIGEVQSLGIGLRLDDDQNALTQVRLNLKSDTTVEPATAQSRAASESAPGLFDEGEFIVHGTATFPTDAFAAVASAYVRLQVNELTAAEQIRLDEDSLTRFYDAVEQAAAHVTSACVLTLPGAQTDGVYTNSYLAVRTADVDKFVELVNEAMRLWNQVNREGQGGPRLVFDVEELSIGDRKAVQYSLDLAEADGAAVLPETRQAMEKLFGPGGKLRLLIGKVDEHTALLAGATPEQAATMLSQLDRKQVVDWQRPPFAEANRFLPEKAAGRIFLSPHGFTSWKAREMAAIVGTEVIGGPLVKEFSASPPIGVAGGLNNDELWLDIAIPAETIRAAGTYLQPKRRTE